jgi:hypothetical protein
VLLCNNAKGVLCYGDVARKHPAISVKLRLILYYWTFLQYRGKVPKVTPVETMKIRRQLLKIQTTLKKMYSTRVCFVSQKVISGIIYQNKDYQKEFSLLSCPVKTILLGSLLGDGSLKIHSGYKNARFSFRHSIKQKEYFMWKRDQLSSISGAKDMWEQLPSPTTSDWQSHKLRYQSRALPALTHLYYLTYQHKGGTSGGLRIWRKWLNMMNPLSLAIWWCDDGSLVKNTKQGVFCTDGFTEKDVKVLDRYMKIVWGINTSVHSVGKTKKDGTARYRLWIRSPNELKRPPRAIIPYIPVSSMLYKVVMLYKDSELQQRWISEIVNGSRFSLNEIENIVATRKSELKAFSIKSENDIVQSLK